MNNWPLFHKNNFVSGLGNLEQLIPQPTLAQCAIPVDLRVKIKKEGKEMIERVFYSSSGFQRGDRVSTPDLVRVSTHRYSVICAKSALSKGNLTQGLPGKLTQLKNDG